VIKVNNTKKAIFDSAIKIFSLNGYDGATMDDISQNAGVAKGTLYYHFKSKEEIFNFIIKEGLQSIKERTEELISKEEDDVSKLLTFCRIQLNLVNEYKDFFKVIMSQLWGGHSRHLELRNAILEYSKDVDGYVKQAMDKGIIKQDNISMLSCSVLGLVCSIAIHKLIRSEEMEEEEEISKMLEYLLEGIKIKE
jgi:TetR/AcrR family transcriptional regulator